jgi:hypothetical protein
MKCPHCYLGRVFSKEMNRFGKRKFCPHCGEGVTLGLGLASVALLFIPAIAICLVLHRWRRWRNRPGCRLSIAAVAETEAGGIATHAARLLLGVYAGNAAAIGFYERVGFGKLGSRQFDVGG